MVKKSIDYRIMEIVKRYVEKVCKEYQIKAELNGKTIYIMPAHGYLAG